MATLDDLPIPCIGDMSDLEALHLILNVRERRKTLPVKEPRITKKMSKLIGSLDESQLDELRAFIMSQQGAK